MAEVLIFETSPEILEEYGDALWRVGLLERCELQLVLRGTDIGAILRRASPRLIMTSWRGIGARVVREANALEPRPVIWVASNYEPDWVRQDGGHPADKVFNKDLVLCVQRICAFFGAEQPPS